MAHERFKVSTDPRFEEKLVDVVGLYLNAPERATVFSLDDKTQVQALDRKNAGSCAPAPKHKMTGIRSEAVDGDLPLQP